MKLRMMVVEDDRDTLEILGVVLQRKYVDMEICTANNGRKGVDLFRQENFDIVITDVNMPEMDGIAMVKSLRAMKPDVQLIFITADTGRATVEHSVGTGFHLDHYIAKPVDYKDLFVAIEKSLEAVNACRG